MFKKSQSCFAIFVSSACLYSAAGYSAECDGVNEYPNWTAKDWAGGDYNHAEAGDQLVYQSQLFQANWYTHSVPGSDASWTLLGACDGVSSSSTSGSTTTSSTSSSTSSTSTTGSTGSSSSSTGSSSSTSTSSSSSGAAAISVELEDLSGQASFAPFTVYTDGNASNNQFVVWPNSGNQVLSAASESEGGLVKVSFTLSNQTDVNFSFRVNMPSGSDDSFYYKMDNGSWLTQNNVATDGFEVLPITTFLNLTAGSHTLTIQRREDGAELDNILLQAAAGTISQSNSSSSSTSSTGGSTSSSTSSTSNSSTSNSSTTGSSGASSTSTSSTSGSSSSSGSSSGGASITIQEQEQGFCGVDGAVDSNNSGYTGVGFANTANANGRGISWSVNSDNSSNVTLTWRFANGSTSNRSGVVSVNGSEVAVANLSGTGAWTAWGESSVNVSLASGQNTLRLVANTSEGLANIDALTITGNGVSTANCPTVGGGEGPVLSQSGNPAQNRFQSARTKWNASLADIILSHQFDNGGWPKNQDYGSSGSGGSGNGTATFDNGATVTEMVYMAQVYQSTGSSKYRDSVRKAMDYVLAAQYSSGGWPQFYPLRGGYSNHVTFNDNAMASVLTVLHNAQQQKAPFDSGIFNDSERAQMKLAVDKGVEYILKSQWRQNGVPTVWCAQHGASDYLPKKARAYELESLSGSESVEIVGFLMTQPQSPEVETAVKNALAWFRSSNTILNNHRYDKSVEEKIVYSSGDRMWYRFYDLNTNRGFFSDRDSRKVYDIMDISEERRNGYSWGGSYGEKLINYADSVGY